MALPLHGLVGGLLCVGHALLDLLAGLTLHLGKAGAAVRGHLAGVIRGLLGLLRGLYGLVLGLASSFCSVAGALHPNLHRVTAAWDGVHQGRAPLAPTVASARAAESAADLGGVDRLAGSGQQPTGV